MLLQAAIEPDPRLTDVPLGLQAARAPEDRQALELFFARVEMGRPFVLPPGVPADRVAAMRAGFDAMLKDKAFLGETDKQRLRVVPISGDQMTAVLANAYKTPPTIVQRTIKALGRGH